MTVVITRNVPGRFDGFLKSCMHEIAPGVYVIPKMNKGVRERLWEILVDWGQTLQEDAGIVLFWSNKNAPSGMAFRLLGWPKKDLIEHEGFWLTFGKLTGAQDLDELKKLLDIDNSEAEDLDSGPTIYDF
jgi:CRISPR-associated protein Cas2